MKKQLLFSILLIFTCLSIFAKDVDINLAKSIAKNFYSSRATLQNGVNPENADFTLAYKYILQDENAGLGQTENNLYYIFNVNTDDGFVIVSGDDIVLPVLGYTNKGSYDGNHLPPAFQKWMEGYQNQILFAKQNNLTATDEIAAKWNELIHAADTDNNLRSPFSVSPLCNTTWDQQPYYNTLCPYDAANTTNQHAVTGCPATAMAQIMKYWNYPATGTGFHSYNHPTYGTLSANFGGTTYNWSGMPNNVTSSNLSVATLMYQCGVSVDMQYGANSSGGYVIINSPTPTANSEYAYKTYFGYNPSSIQGLERMNYSDAAWKNLLKNELDNGRPIQYAGFGSGGGHTFVCDGYDASSFFHMNWGWSGYYDGFFDLDALNPGGLGTGGGSGGYNNGQQAVIGIQPPTGSITNSISMYSSITVTPSVISFGQPFTVNADIINSGTSSFSGDYCAALFTTSGAFVDYVEVLSTGGSPLAAGYHYTGGLTFSNAGLLTVPGTYIIGIYYRPTGGSWSLAGNASYSNPVNVTITGPSNPLEQYSNIVASPSTFVQGQPASVNVNLYNTGGITYYGQYQAALYDLSGNYVQTIGTYNETVGLPSGYLYTSPYITFSTGAITAAPGTYILAILELQSGSSQWYLVGGTYYATPVNITVVAPGLYPDSYESNNTESTAYTLPLSWVSDNAHILTSGANNHIGSDYDYYKINLASGYDYTITTRVHDSYNSGDGNIYSNDVLWSYNTGSTWSLAYDDIMPGNVTVNGAGTVTFQVAPYFAGQMGTYRLDINVDRVVSGIDELRAEKGLLDLYPNPTSNFIHIKNSNGTKLKNLQILNYMGQIVAQIEDSNSSNNIDVSFLTDGIYFLEALEGDKKYSGKFIINK